jgi:hypothetical protein
MLARIAMIVLVVTSAYLQFGCAAEALEHRQERTVNPAQYCTPEEQDADRLFCLAR